MVDLDLKTSKNKYVIDTAPEDPNSLDCLCSVEIGSGEIYACVAMAKHFEKMGYITKHPLKSENSCKSLSAQHCDRSEEGLETV